MLYDSYVLRRGCLHTPIHAPYPLVVGAPVWCVLCYLFLFAFLLPLVIVLMWLNFYHVRCRSTRKSNLRFLSTSWRSLRRSQDWYVAWWPRYLSDCCVLCEIFFFWGYSSSAVTWRYCSVPQCFKSMAPFVSYCGAFGLSEFAHPSCSCCRNTAWHSSTGHGWAGWLRDSIISNSGTYLPQSHLFLAV